MPDLVFGVNLESFHVYLEPSPLLRTDMQG